MVFFKSFSRYVKGSTYPRWEDIFLSELEEREEERKAKIENLRVIHECIEDAKRLIEDQNLKKFQSDLVRIAIALFEKRASHAVYWKESRAREKFDKMFAK